MASVRKREWTHKGEKKTAWIVSYTDQGGKRRIKTFDKKKDADGHRTKVETEIEKGEHTPASTALRLSVIAEEYIRHSEGRARDGKIGWTGHHDMARLVEVSIIRKIGGRLITEITAKDIEQWYEWLITERKFAPATVRGHMRVFRQIESFAIKRGYAKKRSVGEVLSDIGVPPSRPIRTFSQNEVAHLLKTAEIRRERGKPHGFFRGRLYVHLAAFCGLRFGEISGLCLQNVDFESGVVKVRHSLSKLDGLKSPKSRAGVRDVPMPTHVALMLREWIAHHYLGNDRSLLFLSEQATTVAPSAFHEGYWRPLLKRAGYDGVSDRWPRFHSLRHFAASFMINSGLSMPDVASMLGHKKFDTTLQIYAHPIIGGNKRRETVELMSQALISPPRKLQESDIAP